MRNTTWFLLDHAVAPLILELRTSHAERSWTLLALQDTLPEARLRMEVATSDHAAPGSTCRDQAGRRVLGGAVRIQGTRVRMGRPLDQHHAPRAVAGQVDTWLFPRHVGVLERPLHGRALRRTDRTRAERRLVVL